MPHATAVLNAQEEQDDLLIQRALDPENPIDLSRELEPGEKAEDAVDFGDLSDDDLAEDEDEDNGGDLQAADIAHPVDGFESRVNVGRRMQDRGPDDQGYSDDVSGDVLDDLFGERSSSPVDGGDASGDVGHSAAPAGAMSSFESNATPVSDNDHQSPSFTNLSQMDEGHHDAYQDHYGIPRAVQADGGLSKDQQLQQQLFAMSASAHGTTVDAREINNQEDLLAALWPRFQRDTVPKFMELLPHKVARYIGKTPLRRPKPLHPTRLNLEIAMDQEKSFRLSTGTNKRSQEESERQGLIIIERETTDGEHEEEEEGPESDFENEPVGGVSWQDLQIVCEDWDTPDLMEDSSSDPTELDPSEQNNTFAGLGDDWDGHLESRPAKRRKLGRDPIEILKTPIFALPSLRDPEYATARIAKKPILDLNDANLLVDYQESDPAFKSAKTAGFREGERGAFTKKLNRRYNISNDEAYDLLKENHQNKVRSTLGNMVVEHSMPAKKLQWPFYCTKMHKTQARSFHRPLIQFVQNENVAFDKTKVVKRKHLKGKDIKSIYASAKDLSLGDNSSMLLLEYSEEHPTMMSKFGMGSRLINYYRRKNMEDVSRPKGIVGETSVLLPQDKSPFSMFGHIDPGDTTPTLYNAMYRAPVFDHTAKPTDFLVIRNRSGEDGHTYQMRNIENLHVVGQEFPSVDVPGPHSRKVTTAAKNRLKMVSYRLLRNGKHKRGQVSVTEVTPHFEHTTDMQNRQKMKDFLDFSKESKLWVMHKNEPVPEEDTIRAMVKPEDVCLIESMEVGQQHLQDSGFSRGDDQSDDDETKEGQSIERQLAPWYTSRNFLNAAQGKAMLQLHGEGDPTGRGEAFSFIKTSMKGGFKAMGESVEDKLDAKKLKELGGHSYNVARQQKSYEESIRRIWEAQKQSLSSQMEQSDTEMEDEYGEADEVPPEETETPRSELQTPSGMRRLDDETASQFSKMSTNSQAGKVLKITRQVKDAYGKTASEEDVIKDPSVIHHYLKIVRARTIDRDLLAQAKPTGNAEVDRDAKRAIDDELFRLQRNKERRMAREKQKGLSTDGAADSPTSPDDARAAVPAPKPAGTARKCANCGQVGHIKTNKKCSQPFLS